MGHGQDLKRRSKARAERMATAQPAKKPKKSKDNPNDASK
jgi:hypothetical protein